MLKEALKFLIILDKNGTPLFSYGDKEFTENDAAVSGVFQMIKLIQDRVGTGQSVDSITIGNIKISPHPLSESLIAIIGLLKDMIPEKAVENFANLVGRYFIEIYEPILQVETLHAGQRFFRGFKVVLEDTIIPKLSMSLSEGIDIKTSVYFSYEPERTTMKVGEPCKIIIRVYNGYSRLIYLKKVEDAYLKDADAKVDVSGVECITGTLKFVMPKELKPGKSEEICLEMMALEPSSGRFLYPTLYIGLTKSKDELIEISDGTYSFDVTE